MKREKKKSATMWECPAAESTLMDSTVLIHKLLERKGIMVVVLG
jgi:hypothetical protein